jgi:flagellar basal body P-ring formation protein FlgA
MLRLAALLLAATPTVASAGEVVEAARTIRPGEIIAPTDVRLVASDAAGALSAPEDAIGMTARRLLVAGRPVLLGDVRSPPVVRRNGLVALVYRRGALTIRADGRALAEGAAGDRVLVMNLASRQTVAGTVMADGTVVMGDGE